MWIELKQEIMSLKTKIIERLRAKFQGVNLSTARVESIANKLDVKITEETEIDAKLDELNEYFPFADMAKEDDRLRTLEVKAKEKEDKPTDEEKKTEQPKEDEEKVPSWAKAILDKVEKLEGDKVVTSRKSVAIEKFKDAPEAIKNDLLADLEMISFKDDDHFNSYIERKEKALADFKQAQSDAGLGNDKPSNGIGGAKLKDDEVSPEMKELMAERKAATEAKTA